MHDQLTVGRTFRLFNVTDDFNCEALGVEVDFAVSSERVISKPDRCFKNWCVGWELGPNIYNLATLSKMFMLKDLIEKLN